MSKKTTMFLLAMIAISNISRASDITPPTVSTSTYLPDKFIPLKESHDNQKFDLNNFSFNEIVDRILFGDIDNDGKDELITFMHIPEKPAPGDVECISYHLNIYKIEPNGLRLLWTDRGALGYGGCPAIVGIGQDLYFVKDFDNLRTNALIISKGHSDVSPMRFDFYTWDKNKKVLITHARDVKFEKESIVWGNLKTPVEGMILGIQPAMHNGKSMMLASEGELVKSTETYNGQPGRDVLVFKEIYGMIKGTKFIVADLANHLPCQDLNLKSLIGTVITDESETSRLMGLKMRSSSLADNDSGNNYVASLYECGMNGVFWLLKQGYRGWTIADVALIPLGNLDSMSCTCFEANERLTDTCAIGVAGQVPTIAYRFDLVHKKFRWFDAKSITCNIPSRYPD
jgi:hypothetical protein